MRISTYFTSFLVFLRVVWRATVCSGVRQSAAARDGVRYAVAIRDAACLLLLMISGSTLPGISGDYEY